MSRRYHQHRLPEDGSGNPAGRERDSAGRGPRRENPVTNYGPRHVSTRDSIRGRAQRPMPFCRAPPRRMTDIEYNQEVERALNRQPPDSHAESYFASSSSLGGFSSDADSCPTLDDESVYSRPGRGPPSLPSEAGGPSIDLPGFPTDRLHLQFQAMTLGNDEQVAEDPRDSEDRSSVVAQQFHNAEIDRITSIPFDSHPLNETMFIMKRTGVDFWNSWCRSAFIPMMFTQSDFGLGSLKRTADRNPQSTLLKYIGESAGWERHELLASWTGNARNDWLTTAPIHTSYVLKYGSMLAVEPPRLPLEPIKEVIPGFPWSFEPNPPSLVTGRSAHTNALGWLVADTDGVADWDSVITTRNSHMPGQGYNVLSCQQVREVDREMRIVTLRDIQVPLGREEMTTLFGTVDERGVRRWDPEVQAVGWATLILRTRADISDLPLGMRTHISNMAYEG